MPKTPTQIPFSQVIQALLDEGKPFPPRYLYRLSDLSAADLGALADAWQIITPRRRLALMEDIREMNDSDYLQDFSGFCRLTIKDEDPRVRILAIETLVEYEALDLVSVFVNMLEQDPIFEVRAAAASALGSFIYLGEIEEIPEKTLHVIERRLLQVMDGKDDVLVRRRALEALGFSSREEVPGLIQAAYVSGDRDWLISALFAMGRSYNMIWEEKVLERLDDDDAGVRAEAVTAAGELSSKKALPQLLELLQDEDDDVRAAAIWAVSEIGGLGVKDALEAMLDESEDDEEADLLEEALDNLDFVDGMGDLSILDFEDEDEDPGEDLDEDDLKDHRKKRG